MAPTDTLKEFEALEHIGERSPDHCNAVSYVQTQSEDGRSAQRASAIIFATASAIAAVFHERVPAGSALAATVAIVAGVLWTIGTCIERSSRKQLSALHAPRIRMLLQQIREAVPSLEPAVQRAEEKLLGGKG